MNKALKIMAEMIAPADRDTTMCASASQVLDMLEEIERLKAVVENRHGVVGGLYMEAAKREAAAHPPALPEQFEAAMRTTYPRFSLDRQAATASDKPVAYFCAGTQHAWNGYRLAVDACGVSQPSLTYPDTMTPELAHILGLSNFRIGPIAHVFQAAGHSIARKCEAEQAFVLDRMIRAVLQHGPQWAKVFTLDLEAQRAIITEQKSKGSKS